MNNIEVEKKNNPINKYYQKPIKSQNQNPNDGKTYDIGERTFEFGKRILDIVDMVPKIKIIESLRTQLLKSGTSIGANVEEADGTLTKRDFINKLNIARKEAKETKFWLKLISGKYIKKEELKNDIQEVQELINILSTIIYNTKCKDQKN